MSNKEKLMHEIEKEQQNNRSRFTGHRDPQQDLAGIPVLQIYEHLAIRAVDTLHRHLSDIINHAASGSHFRAGLNRLPWMLSQHHIFGSNLFINTIRDLFVDGDGTSAHVIFEFDEELSKCRPPVDYVSALKQSANEQHVYTWGEVTWLLVLTNMLGICSHEFRDSLVTALRHSHPESVKSDANVDSVKWSTLITETEKQHKALIALY